MKNNLFYRILLFILVFQLPILFAFGRGRNANYQNQRRLNHYQMHRVYL